MAHEPRVYSLRACEKATMPSTTMLSKASPTYPPTYLYTTFQCFHYLVCTSSPAQASWSHKYTTVYNYTNTMLPSVVLSMSYVPATWECYNNSRLCFFFSNNDHTFNAYNTPLDVYAIQ